MGGARPRADWLRAPEGAWLSAVCLSGYSAPGTPTANRFVGLSPRDPAFLHQQQVRPRPLHLHPRTGSEVTQGSNSPPDQ